MAEDTALSNGATPNGATPNGAIRGIAAPAAERPQLRRLMWFFAVVYVVEGLGQVGGLISQPLAFYLKQTQGWTPLQVTASLSIITFPWVIKPVWGIVSDFVPLFGYRRKAYLLLASVVAAGAYAWITRIAAPGELISVLLLSAYAMAIISTLCGAVLVENGQRLSASDAFVNQQWLWFNVAGMAASFLGGQLVQRLSPAGALHMAAAVIAVAPVGVVLGSLFLIEEQRSRLDLSELKRTFRALISAFTLKDLWLIALFLFLFYLNPGFGTPLYYYMTDHLKFSQEFIGLLGAIGSAGWIAGAVIYRYFLKGISAKRLINLAILLGTLTTASFVLLSSAASAAIINFANGIAGMITFVATLSLAADFCPQRAEGFAFAALMSILNLASALSGALGSFLYEHVFANRLNPLILLSAGLTALIFLFVPLLRLGGKQPGAAARSAAE
jgi:MFS family permease